MFQSKVQLGISPDHLETLVITAFPCEEADFWRLATRAAAKTEIGEAKERSQRDKAQRLMEIVIRSGPQMTHAWRLIQCVEPSLEMDVGHAEFVATLYVGKRVRTRKCVI
jgi:hypothetical protein